MDKPSFRNTPDLAYSRYLEDGYFVESNVISLSDCNRFIAAGRELPEVRQGDFKPVIQPHRLNQIFLEPMRHPAIVSTMNRLISGNVVGLQTEFFYGMPGVRGFAKHQDNFFVEAQDDSFASAWIALTDVYRENGGLYGYPGSHKEGRLPVRRIEVGGVVGQDPNANNEETIVPDRYHANVKRTLRWSFFAGGGRTSWAPIPIAVWELLVYRYPRMQILRDRFDAVKRYAFHSVQAIQHVHRVLEAPEKTLPPHCSLGIACIQVSPHENLRDRFDAVKRTYLMQVSRVLFNHIRSLQLVHLMRKISWAVRMGDLRWLLVDDVILNDQGDSV